MPLDAGGSPSLMAVPFIFFCETTCYGSIDLHRAPDSVWKVSQVFYVLDFLPDECARFFSI